MAYTTHPTVVTGQVWSAANQNSYVKDNLAALWVFTAAGDMMYATAATTATRLAKPAGNSVMTNNGSVPGWTAAGASGTLAYSNGALTWLAAPGANSVLTHNATIPAWTAAGASGTLAYSNGALTWLAKPASLALLQHNATVPSYLLTGSEPYSIARLDAAGTALEFGKVFEKTIVYPSAGVNVPGGAVTAMAMNTESVDEGGWHSNVTNNSRITPGVAG